MLQGKPAGESESVTMNAIKGILDDNEAAFEAVRRDADTQNTKTRRGRKQTFIEPAPTTQPVKVIDERVPSAKFTTVPSPDVPEQDNTLRSQPLAELKPVDAGSARFEPLSAADTKSTQDTPKLTSLWKSVRPHVTWNRVCFFGLVGLALFRPGLVIFTIVLTLATIVGAFLILGADRIWDAVAGILARVQKRSPARGEKMRKWLDTVAYRWDGVLDRFPDGAVDVLYMPDFSHRALEQQRHEAVVADRLDRMHDQV